MNVIKLLSIAVLSLVLAACEPKAPEGGTTVATPPEVVVVPEVIVSEEIPEDLRAEAASEITEANADEMAAKLEAEIEADQ